MTIKNIQDFIRLVPTVKKSPQNVIWMTLDQDADLLYINFKKPSFAADSELTDDDVIIRYDGEEIIGYTVLHASQR